MTKPTWDAIVVGSGFGGAVTAARLAESGHRVLILERGTWWDGDRVPASGRTGPLHMVRGVRYSTRSRSMSLGVRRHGLYELHQFDRLTCVVSSGVGGGSLVYTDMQVPPPDAYLDAFPDCIDAAEMRPHIDAVRTMLAPRPVAPIPQKARAFDRAVTAAGLGPVHFPDLALTSHPHGKPSRATMGTTYLPMALRHGAELRAMSEVVAMSQTPDGGWQVRYRDHERGRSYVESAPRLILSAGTLGTMRLLFDARDRLGTLPLVSSALGRGFTPNGDMVTVVHRTAQRVDSVAGPPITAYLTAEGRRDFLTAEVGLRLHHMAPSAAAARLLPRTALLIGMGADRIASEATYDGRNLHLSTNRDDDSELFDRLAEHATAIASGYRAKRTIVNAPFGRGSTRLASVHPLGGVPMAESPTSGVVDTSGQVHNYPGLFVADGSILPSAPGIPPAMTIAAMAERISHQIHRRPETSGL
ncbi:GMC oxidoreductase [Rhodococcoides fascians]|uniref:GMC oxidoreductase n=1 Tax=Rhodococcoides fascians TaxID=1828 RepID=UPI0009B849DC|nr:GMC oxidoreductase [Rhodococcus fascians]